MTERLCPICKGNVIRRKVQYSLLGEKIGIFPADVCQKCKEQFFTKEISQVIERITQEKGLWNLRTKTKVSKVGNSLAIRINKKTASFLNLKPGQEVVLSPENRKQLIMSKLD